MIDEEIKSKNTWVGGLAMMSFLSPLLLGIAMRSNFLTLAVLLAGIACAIASLVMGKDLPGTKWWRILAVVGLILLLFLLYGFIEFAQYPLFGGGAW